MAKKITGLIKLQIPAGQANPAPPVGPALGQHGVNIMAFCKEFNAKTKDQPGMIIPVVITVYQDKSFTFITKSPPASVLLKKAAGITAGSKEPNKEKVGKVTRYGKAGREVHHKPPESVMTIAFELDGQRFTALNGGPVFKFNEAISLQVNCETQAEVDHY